MTVREFAEVLRSPDQHNFEGSFYQNVLNQEGYRALFWHQGKWYWYSVSGISRKVNPSEVAEAITGERARIRRANRYKVDGFEATVWLPDHVYMLNMGSVKPRF